MNEHRQADGHSVRTESRSPAPRLRTRALLVGIVVVLAGGLAVEQVGAVSGGTAAGGGKWSSFRPTGAAAQAATTLGDVPTGPAALAAENQHVDAALARTQAATTGSGTAAQTDPRLIALGARICPILLEEAAELIAQTNRLIAANPALAPQLIAARDAGLARINVQLARYGCPAISFG